MTFEVTPENVQLFQHLFAAVEEAWGPYSCRVAVCVMLLEREGEALLAAEKASKEFPLIVRWSKIGALSNEAHDLLDAQRESQKATKQ